MALTSVEETQLRDLLAQQSALLSLAGNEPTITSKLGATKVNLSQLPAATTVDDADLMLIRQGTTDKSVTGSQIRFQPDASETVKGIVELATSAEAQAFTANKFIDGAKLAAAFLGSNSGVNWMKMPNGYILQWGQAGSIPAGGSQVITYPIAFPNSVLSMAFSNAYASASGSITASVGATFSGATASFTLYNHGTSPSNAPGWIAIGN